MNKQSFDIIILTGRAGAGKSEFIDFLKKTPKEQRLEKYHVGAFEELDDFVWIWNMGVDDDIWESLGKERLHTINVGHGYTESHDRDLLLTDFMTKKMNHELTSHYLKNEKYFDENSLFVEFARGGDDCFKKTFDHFDKDVLERVAVFFIDNTPEESERRNEARYQAKAERSILAHKTPEENMIFYRTNDWNKLVDEKRSGYLNVKGVNLPFVSVWNIPELTDPKQIEERFAPPVIKLWDLYTNR